MEVSTERCILSRSLIVTFKIDERKWRDFFLDEYGPHALRHMPSLFDSVDPVGEMLHLLREFYLSESKDPSRIQKVNVETVEPATPILPPATENNHGLY
jgi:hypothetical protein